MERKIVEIPRKNPEQAQPESARLEQSTIPDLLPLHNTFIALREIGFEYDSKRKPVGEVRKFTAERNAQSTEEYLAQGRGSEYIAAARQHDVELLERHEKMVQRGAEIRRQRELAKQAKENAEREAGALRRFGGTLTQTAETFVERIREVYELAAKRVEVAQSQLFARLKPAEHATPEQIQLLTDAQAAGKLAEKLEKDVA